MKKILFVLLASVLLFATACNGETSAPSNPPASTTTESELNDMNSIAMPTDSEKPNEDVKNLVKEVFDVLLSAEQTNTSYNYIFIEEYDLFTCTSVETSTSATTEHIKQKYVFSDSLSGYTHINSGDIFEREFDYNTETYTASNVKMSINGAALPDGSSDESDEVDIIEDRANMVAYKEDLYETSVLTINNTEYSITEDTWIIDIESTKEYYTKEEYTVYPAVSGVTKAVLYNKMINNVDEYYITLVDGPHPGTYSYDSRNDIL